MRVGSSSFSSGNVLLPFFRSIMKSRNKQIVSVGIFVGILFLLRWYQQRNTSPPDIKLNRTKKEGKGNVDMEFLNKVKDLISVVLPSWRCKETFNLTLLTLLLVGRTWLSIVISGINGRIVKAIVTRDFLLFIKRVRDM
jgi:hypothetical protein